MKNPQLTSYIHFLRFMKVLLMNLNIFDELQFVTVIISDAHIVSYLSVETLFSWLLTLLT